MRSFKQIIEEEKTKKYFINLINFLNEEYNTKTIFPKKDEIFKALELTPIEKVKVVIFGQDPYHEKNQAHGLAFSILPGNPCPPSLRNIYKEIKTDLGENNIEENYYLEDWAKKGVLLLNTVLTVREGEAFSHKNKGWEIFVKEIVKELNLINKKIVFMLWGNSAKSFKNLLNNKNHLILEAAHPSPLSANRGFFGCKHFSKAENFLGERIWTKT